MSSELLRAIGRPVQLTEQLQAEPLYPNACSTEGCTADANHAIGDFRFCDACRQDLQLPACEPYRAGETVVDHGARVLAFILQTSCYATLSDTELERAHVASQYAICARGISVPAADRLSDVRHVITATLTWRKGQPAEPPAIVEGGQLSGKLGTGGPADREPLQPKPKTEPPQGVAIDLAELDGTYGRPAPWQGAGDKVRF